MPLVNTNKPSGLIVTSPTAQNPVVVPTVMTSDPKYQGLTVDTRWTPTSALLAHLSGSAWSVNYYSQVITTDSSLSGHRPSVTGLNQQYRKIENLVMRVTAPLGVSQDAETKEMKYSGRSVVHSFIPNEGDMFIADLGNGDQATFRVTASEKKSIFKQAAYEIDYDIGSADPAYLRDLENKVVETLVWRDDLITYGQSPVILKSHDALLDQAANTVKAVLRQYFDRFFSNEYRTLIVPDQNKALYDPFLARFMTQMLTSDDCLEMVKLKVLNVKDDPVYLQNNLWQAIAEQDEAFLQGGFTRAGITETYRFEPNPFFSGIRFTGVPLVIYPINPTPGIQGVVTERLKTLSSEPFKPSEGGDLTMFEDSNTGALPQNATTPGLYRVTFDDYYVLSQNFYDQTSEQSVLESMVRRQIKRQTLDLEALMKTARSFDKWGLVEQFYYVPLVLALIRGGTFSS